VFVAIAELPSRSSELARAIEGELRALVAALEPDGAWVGDATRLWKTFDVIERLAMSAKTLLARRVEDAGAWKREGFRSPAEHLANVAGTSVNAARRQLETSKQIEALPATADAVRAGRLSAPKAEAIAAAATVAPDAEAELLHYASRAPLSQLRDECLRTKARVDRDATHARIHRERSLREYTDAEGAWNLVARGTVIDGAAVRAALEPLIKEEFKAARAEGRHEPREAYAFDALVGLAARGAADSTRTRLRFLGLIRVDHDALCRGRVEGDEVCEIAGLGPIPVEVARKLLGDATLKLVVTKGVDVRNVTNLGRSATVAQQVALWWSSPLCTVDGCSRTHRLETDHRTGWAKTHETRLDDLDRLCAHHHDLKTYQDWALIEGSGRRPMVPPDDPRHPRNRPPPDQ
jgi:hypothetical protein